MPLSNLEERLESLEAWRRETDKLLKGDLAVPGIVPLLVSVAEIVKGPHGEGGLVKQTNENSQAIRDSKIERKTASFILGIIGSLIGGAITVLAAHLWK